MTDNKAINDETAGRLRREFAAYYAGMKIIPNQSEWLMADAIDRLAADVAEIKEAVCGNHSKTSNSSPAAPQPAAPPAGWLTEEEKRCLPEVLDDLRRWGYAKSAEVIEAILSRACSPPVVEVPALSPATYGFNSPFFSGEYRAGRRQACLTHRAALDKAGVQWKEKEVGRE